MSHRHFIREHIRNHLNQLVILAEREFNSASTNIHTHNTSGVLRIATHNGHFHTDEALACALLRHTKAFRGAQLVRTRNMDIINACDVAVDVGAVYDEEKYRFDHHQASFSGTMQTSKKLYLTRLSSAGLVYKHYGREIIENFLEATLNSPARSAFLKMAGRKEEDCAKFVSKEELELIFDAVYSSFVEEVDGIDNGLDPYTIKGDENKVEGVEIVKRYIQTTTLSNRVGRLNASWNEEKGGNNHIDSENARFAEAMELTISEFFEAVFNCVFVWLPARAIVEEGFHAASNLHTSGQIFCMRRFCPWKNHLFDLEEEHHCEGRFLFMIYPDLKGWRVNAVPKKDSGFENRVPLQYRGLRDEKLSEASGIADGIFVHVSGFTGGMKTYEGALQLAINSLPTTSSE
ncbi:unnamed protein product [Phytomonas sp. Hart1]|nr:unnamed protein product [Phytomonas sp. Hart1]|eukprot:CCW66685.1 unnamed protein product [Phytomonas sp. isolate Hart1]